MNPLDPRRILVAATVSAIAGLCAAPPGWAGQETTSAEGPPQAASEALEATERTGPAESSAPSDARAASTAGRTDRSAALTGEDASGTAGKRKRRRLGERTLREGMRGSDVRHLQKILTGLNFETRVSGRYRRTTKRSVRRYERWKEKRVNGVVHMPQARRMKELYRAGARYRNHVFPVRGPHDYGGTGSRFGAPRSGHTHQGQDIAAAEGTRLVAVHEGRVTHREYQAGGAGHYIVISGRDGSDSVYMHLQRRARVAPGRRVMAGQTIGRVGTTGASTGPHLHFELWTRHWYAGGSPYDPLPKLKRWDRRT